MENVPLQPSPETSTDDKEEKKDSKKKKKGAEALGSLIVETKEPEQPETKAEVPEQSFWEKLSGKTAELVPEETQAVERQLAEAARPEAAAASPEEASQPEEVAAEHYVERFHSKIIDEDKDSDTALSETLMEIDAPAENINEKPAENEPEPQKIGEEGVVDEADNEPPANVPVATASSSAGNGSGGRTAPPGPPVVPPGPPRPPAAPLPGAAPAFGPPAGFNAPPIAQPNVLAVQPENNTAAALVGGIVGYLIGRRRGRIKTEKRLLPIQQKLEQTVNDMRLELQMKEQVIRLAAREKIRTEKNLQEVTGRRFEALKPAPAAVEILKRQTGQEVNVKPEKIGKVVVSAETLMAKKIDKTPSGAGLSEKDVLTISHRELLELSEKIELEGTTLRRVYESQVVSEKGLRRLVLEYLRGGNLQKALRRELVEREIDFNRDPALRDRVLGSALNSARSGGAHPLDDLLKKAGIQLEDAPAVQFGAADAKKAAVMSKLTASPGRIVDFSLITAIIVLLAVIVYVALRG